MVRRRRAVLMMRSSGVPAARAMTTLARASSRRSARGTL
jgi:hypothetical protein